MLLRYLFSENFKHQIRFTIHVGEPGGIKCDTNTFIATTYDGDRWIHKPKNKALAKALGFLVDTPTRIW